jgi:hypothetical protein
LYPQDAQKRLLTGFGWLHCGQVMSPPALGGACIGTGDGIETRGGAAVDAWGGGAWGGAGCAAGTPCGGVFAENGLGA